MSKPEHVEYAAEIAEQEERVARHMTPQEIFEAGFKEGLSKAGLTENAEYVWLDWLLARVP